MIHIRADEEGRRKRQGINMEKTIEAVFDGTVFRPIEPPALEPNTRVRIVFNTISHVEDSKVSFLNTARSLNLEGPPDWSKNLESYLYGKKTNES